MSDGHVYWDAASALERLGGDEGLFREIVQIFLHEAPKHLAGLRQALAQKDKDSVERIAHTLKRRAELFRRFRRGVSRQQAGGCWPKWRLRMRCQHPDVARKRCRGPPTKHASCFARKDIEPISDPTIWSSFQWLRRQFRSNLESTSLHQPSAFW